MSVSSDLEDLLMAYLEAAFHATLHARGVYPPELFEPRRVLDVPVRIARHPALKVYLRDAVLSVREAMTKGPVERVELVLLPAAGFEPVPFERHVFDLGATRLRAAAGEMSDDDLDVVEQGLRASLSHISRLDHRLARPLGETTFAIIVHTPESFDLTRQEDLQLAEKWVPEPIDDAQTGGHREVHAVKHVSLRSFRMSHYVEATTPGG
ncbi:DNA-binding protein [Pavlovales sp. CCMP2436]|nr:DNA-binding protein [Pavlovales sp. CCMP2436]